MVQILTNARIETPTEDFIGTLQIEDEYITDISKTNKIYDNAINLGQQWLTPGCIDIHSDYIERSYIHDQVLISQCRLPFILWTKGPQHAELPPYFLRLVFQAMSTLDGHMKEHFHSASL